MKGSKVDISLNHDVMTSLSLHKWPRLHKSGANLASGMVYGCTHIPLNSIPMAQSLYICLIWMYEAVWGGHQAHPWGCGIVSTPQVTLTSQIWGQLGRCNGMGAPICPWAWDSITIAQTLCIRQIWMYEVVWGGYKPQPWCNDIISTPQVTMSPQIWGRFGWCNGIRVHLYSLETAYQWLKHFIYA